MKIEDLPPSAEHIRAQRVQIRIAPTAKRVIERAAALRNSKVSGFVVSNALDAANHLVRGHERLVIEARDRDVFLDAVVDPSEPDTALREAVRTHMHPIESARSAHDAADGASCRVCRGALDGVGGAPGELCGGTDDARRRARWNACPKGVGARGEANREGFESTLREAMVVPDEVGPITYR